MLHNYPYTDFHELNLDYILTLARKALGLHLETQGKFLKLVNQAGEDISKLQVTYAETALKDDSGHNIDAYILNAGVDGRSVVFTKGNGELTTITVPYAVVASKDVNNRDLTDYVRGVGVTGDKILITFGNDTTYSFTVPYATKASKDDNGKVISTYVAELTTGNDKLIVKDGLNNVLAEITIPYAVKAKEDIDGDNIKEIYGTELTTGSTTVELRNKEGSVISTITVPYAVKALTDTEGNAFLADYAYNLFVDGNKIGVESHTGVTLNEITVPFATLSTDATNAIESVSISGDNLRFTTYGGVNYDITVPYSVKALKDNLNNTLSHTYIASAVNDPDTGKISFYAQDGSLVSEMIPTFDRAIHDSYNNVIADYVKSVVTDPNSDYVTVTHGTGDTDTLTVHYSTKAWKDTYGNVIGNTYIRRLACVVDADTAHYMLVAYNGELSELFRIELRAYMAQVDVNEKDLTSYVAEVSVDSVDDTKVNIVDGNSNTLNTIQGTVTTEPSGTISGTAVTLTTDTVDEVASVGTLPSVTYDGTTQTLIFDAGTLPTTASVTVATGIDTVTDPTFTGDTATDPVNFN